MKTLLTDNNNTTRKIINFLLHTSAKPQIPYAFLLKRTCVYTRFQGDKPTYRSTTILGLTLDSIRAFAESNLRIYVLFLRQTCVYIYNFLRTAQLFRINNQFGYYPSLQQTFTRSHKQIKQIHSHFRSRDPDPSLYSQVHYYFRSINKLQPVPCIYTSE